MYLLQGRASQFRKQRFRIQVVRHSMPNLKAATYFSAARASSNRMLFSMVLPAQWCFEQVQRCIKVENSLMIILQFLYLSIIGFMTAKGELLKSILYPVPIDYLFKRHCNYVLFALFIISLFFAGFDAYVMVSLRVNVMMSFYSLRKKKLL